MSFVISEHTASSGVFNNFESTKAKFLGAHAGEILIASVSSQVY